MVKSVKVECQECHLKYNLKSLYRTKKYGPKSVCRKCLPKHRTIITYGGGIKMGKEIIKYMKGGKHKWKE